MDGDTEREAMIERAWHELLTTGMNAEELRARRIFQFLPGDPRCKICHAPFHGIGGGVVKALYGKRRSNLNPQLCNICERFAQEYQGGAEIDLSLLFADVRGSSTLAEQMTPTAFSKLINRFYNTATHVMVHTNALIDKIIGDQVAGMFVPGFAGPQHARQAIAAAKEILTATGHGAPDGPWISLGVGVHTGRAFVGAVGSSAGTTDITVLGDAPNTAARLSSSARVGEILISEAARSAAGLDTSGLERRALELKGKSEVVAVYVLTDYT
ncbi:MAG: adenylate/guanylate cyclase domain-containing protein [Chloroflexi bacterium]|nr:adenylate/guanylate cyclase domain-containing protein [Chloroflexota bacterium]